MKDQNMSKEELLKKIQKEREILVNGDPFRFQCYQGKVMLFEDVLAGEHVQMDVVELYKNGNLAFA